MWLSACLETGHFLRLEIDHDKTHSINEVCDQLHISRSTLRFAFLFDLRSPFLGFAYLGMVKTQAKSYEEKQSGSSFKQVCVRRRNA